MKLFYRLFYKGFLRYHLKQQQPKKGLKYAFTDIDGRKYYTFQSFDQMPQARRTELTDLMIAYNMKVDMPTLDTILTGAAKLAKEAYTTNDAKKRQQALARLNVACSEIPLRFEKTMPVGIIIRAAAVMSIRDDESQMEVDDALTDEKERYFRECARNGYAFFLSNSTLRNYYDIWRVSKPQFLTLFLEWEQAGREVKAILKELTFGGQ